MNVLLVNTTVTPVLLVKIHLEALCVTATPDTLEMDGCAKECIKISSAIISSPTTIF